MVVFASIKAFKASLDCLCDPFASFTQDVEVVHVFPLGWQCMPEHCLVSIGRRHLSEVLGSVCRRLSVSEMAMASDHSTNA